MTAPFAQVTKEDVAEVLLRIAAILELAEDNPYRALAYRRAARLVLDAPRPLHELLTPRGRLDLPGLGTRPAPKLGELVMTGRLWFGLEMSAGCRKRQPICSTSHPLVHVWLDDSTKSWAFPRRKMPSPPHRRAAFAVSTDSGRAKRR